jgi:hypothetical protein
VLIALEGPGSSCHTDFHLCPWLGGPENRKSPAVAAAAQRTESTKPLCQSCLCDWGNGRKGRQSPSNSDLTAVTFSLPFSRSQEVQSLPKCKICFYRTLAARVSGKCSQDFPEFQSLGEWEGYGNNYLHSFFFFFFTINTLPQTEWLKTTRTYAWHGGSHL